MNQPEIRCPESSGQIIRTKPGDSGGPVGLERRHPTIAGYGIIGQAVLDVLNAAGIASPRINFTQLLAQDT